MSRRGLFKCSIILVVQQDGMHELMIKMSSFTMYTVEPPNNNHSWEHVFWPLLRVWLLSEVINTYFYVSRSMPLDCCREFSLFSGGHCSEVSL